VKSRNRNLMLMLMLFAYAFAVIVLSNHAVAATDDKGRQLSQGENANISGLILSRDGDLIRVHDKKLGEVIVVKLDGSTKVERTKYKFPFYRHIDLDVTALLPGLNIEVEGVGNSAGQLDARKISFSPDDFAVEVAEEQQAIANKAAAQSPCRPGRQESESGANIRRSGREFCRSGKHCGADRWRAQRGGCRRGCWDQPTSFRSR
jgi:hypothetical protein